MNIYHPILKSKAGELRALKELKLETSSKIKPILCIQQPPYDWENKKFSKSLVLHLDATAKKLSESIPFDMIPFIDFDFISKELCNDKHHVEYFFAQLDALAVDFDVVTGLDRHHDKIFQKIIKQRSQNPHTKICLRLSKEECELFSVQQEEFLELLNFFEVSAEQVEVLLDMKSIPADAVVALKDTLAPCIEELISLECKSIIIALGTMPENMGDFKSNEISMHPRLDLHLWEELRKIHGGIVKFGDYGVLNPSSQEIDPRIMTRAPRIRYTTTRSWQIFKGQSTKVEKEQTPKLSKMVVEHECYEGSDFSWGDEYIKDCAEGKHLGNATNWVSADTNHHLEFVSKQISTIVD